MNTRLATGDIEQVIAAIVQRDVVVVTGPEAQAYLHGQVSADIEALGEGDSALSFLLEPRGRVEVLFSISRTGPEVFVLDTEPGFGDSLATSLERFKLRTRAEFERHEWSMLALRGPQTDIETLADATLRLGPLEAGEDATRRVVRAVPWLLAAGVDLLTPTAAAAATAFVEFENVNHVSADEFGVLRMVHGLPAMGSEIRPGDIPNETGIVELAASFTKGCYRGQELVERIDSRTGGRRILRRITTQSPFAVGDTLYDAQGNGVATVRSVRSRQGTFVGFALARSDAPNTLATVTAESVQLADL